MSAPNLTLVSQSFDTLLPDGTHYYSQTNPSNVVARIGERRKIILTLNASDPIVGYPTSLAGYNLFLNIGLFINTSIITSITGPGVNYWSAPLPNPIVPNQDITAALVVGTGYADVSKNYTVTIRTVTDTQIRVTIEYYQIYDTGSYLNPIPEDNHSKLLKDRISNSIELTTSGDSVYTNANCVPRIRIYLEDSTNALNNSTYQVNLTGYGAGFYAKNKHNAAPYFSNPVFTLTRSAVVVTGLSTSADTKVSFKITNPAGVLKVFAWLIRVDTFDDTVDFLTNYEASFADVITSGSGHNKIKSPLTSPTHIGSNVYESTFFIDKTQLVQDTRYRIICIAYYANGSVEVNSYISDEYAVDAYPCYQGDGIDFTANLADYDKVYTGNNLECVVEERMRSMIQMDYTLDKWKDDIFNRLGLVVTNDIRRYLTNIDLEIYETYTDPLLGTVKNIFDRKNAVKLNATTYSTPSGMVLNFGTDLARFYYYWRNRYEDHLPCIQTLVNGVAQTPVFETQNWADKTLYVEWRLKFIYDDYTTPFSDTIILYQMIRVADYNREILIKNQDTTQPNKTSFCKGEEMCLYGELATVSPTDYHIINNIEASPGNSSTIEESEQWVGGVLDQLTTDKIYDQDSAFGANKKGNFCIDTTKLIAGLTYKISMIAKKI